MAIPRTPDFIGRSRERRELDRLLNGVRGGDSAVLVVRGEPGIGKTALMNHCARQATGCRVVQITGVESEMEMSLSAVHQLCGPMLGGVAALPAPQAQALQVAFGLEAGSPPDQFVVGLAVLSLLAETAAKQPLVCLVDDAQWLDVASSQVLGFVGRRLLAESVLLLLGVREVAEDRLFPGLPAMTLEGLNDDDARSLLTAAVPGQLNQQVRDRLVAETRGNPLALLELPGGVSQAELAGGFSVAAGTTVSGHLREHYLRRVRALSVPTQRLMLLAAADATGDAPLLWRAAQTLGVGRDAADEAVAAQLLEIGSGVRFRHPLVRSAAYDAGSAEDRRAAHGALADATDAQTDPEHRVWHLAVAATGRDEDVASELERIAGRAQARAGLAAAAVFLQRSVALTADPGRRADRALAAALAHVHAGAFDAALGLLAEAEVDAVDDLQRARVEQLRGRIEWASNSGSKAPLLLLQAARRLESLHVGLARETYLAAWVASLAAGRLAEPGGGLLEVSEAARLVAQPGQAPRPCDLLLDGLAMLITDGRAAAGPTLRRAVGAFLNDQVSADEWLQWGMLAQIAAMALWDVDSWVVLSGRQVEVARSAGALAPLALALNGHGLVSTWRGDFEAATKLIAGEEALKEVTGTRLSTTGALLLAAYRGRPAEAMTLTSATDTDSISRGEGVGSRVAHWALAVLHNGLGRYADALAAAQHAAEEEYAPFSATWVLPELVEAAVRTGSPERGAEALRRLSEHTDAGVDWAAGIEARSRALLSDGQEAEHWYAEAIERLGRTPLEPELARAHLLYGEWLRRESRRADARVQLRTAYDLFATMGAEAFAERSRRELLAAGEKIRRREVDAYTELTPQEEHIARLARDGRTNPEIGAELFISARTVEWHLGHVFTKLDITSRKGLHDALPARLQYTTRSNPRH